MRLPHLLPALLLTALAACTSVGPDYQLPDEAAVQRTDLQGPLLADERDLTAAALPDTWWQLYHDPLLDQLIEQALIANSDLRLAQANLAAARARVSEAQEQGGFEGSADTGVQRLQESGEAFLLPDKVPVANIGVAEVKVSYQLDLWGTLARGVEAAQANADAQQAAADVARITVVADVAQAYTQVCAANEERHIAESSLALQQQSHALTQQLRDAGRGNDNEVTRADAQTKYLSSQLPKFEAARQSGLFRLSMLLATPLDALPAGVSDCSALPQLSQLLPVGDGAAMLRRRPDIRQAERQLAAATARIGIATGQLYPDISLGATVGTIGLVENLGTASANRWGFGPLISWTFPTNGARARIAAAEANTQGALAQFDGVVLNAMRETRTAMVEYTAALDRRDAMQASEQAAALAASQTQQLYRAGRVSFLDELQATRNLTDMRAELAAVNTEVTLRQIKLFLALGGGWQTASAAAQN